MRIRLVISSLIALVAVASSFGQTPLGTAFTYQGQLKQGDMPVHGTADFQFTLWNVAGSGNPPMGGVQVGGVQVIHAQQVASGLFTVALNGSGEFGPNAFNGNARWLQIAVRSPASGGGFTVLAPRQPLTAVPYATFASSAPPTGPAGGDMVGAYPNPQLATLPTSLEKVSGGAMFTDGSFVGIGTTNPTAKLDILGDWNGVDGALRLRGDKPTIGLSGGPITNDTRWIMHLGSNPAGALSFARNITATTFSFLLTLTADDRVGIGTVEPGFKLDVNDRIRLREGLSGSAGLWLYQTAPANDQAFVGMNDDSQVGLYGATGAGWGLVMDTTNGNIGVGTTNPGGVRLNVQAGSSSVVGVLGEIDRPGGFGVYGSATDSLSTNTGVVGKSRSVNGTGVFGLVTATSGTIYGVFGLAASADGYGVFANGNMGASGVKPFRIDHPDDPTNRYLLHYAAESPEVINLYSGKATLDGAGEAVVELPRYFAKINKDPRYTLTAVGAPMPMLHVAEEIDEAALSAGATAGPGVAASTCSFRIAGGAPGAKVSWEVKAVRNDLWVQKRAMPMEVIANGVSIQTRAMPVEVEKRGREKGTYQHPELYGLSAEMGMNYVAPAERALDYRPDTERPASRTLPDATPH